MNQTPRMSASAALSLAAVLALLMLPVFFHINNLLAEKSLVITGLYTLFALLLGLLPLTVFRPLLFVLLMLPFLIIMPFELIHVINYDGYSTLAAFVSSIETNPGEASEFIHDYRHYFFILYPLIALATLAALFKIKWSYKLPARFRMAIAIGFFLVLSLFTVRTLLEQRKGEGLYLASVSNLYGRLFTQNYPFAHLVKAVQYIQQHRAMQAALAQKQRFEFHARASQDWLAKKPVVILVIGETSRAHNWQLSGYSRPTNPLLSKRASLSYFDHAVTAATHTSQTIQLVLSRATPGNLEPLYHEKSLVAAFAEAGYTTVWLSNQNMTGGVETAVYTIALEADERHFTGGDYRIKGKPDEVLVGMLQTTLEQHRNKPLFVVIHTMGSHEVYRNRYPPAFARFQPASTGNDYNFATPGMRERLLNSYDNSILYTDYVLDQLIETASRAQRPITLTYFSDHGENVLDDEARRFGHGGVIPTLYVTDVPLFVWTGNKFCQLRPLPCAALAGNRHKPATTLHVFDTLLDLGEITLDQQPPSHSLASPTYQAGERTILNTSYKAIRYDDIVKTVQKQKERPGMTSVMETTTSSVNEKTGTLQP